MRERTSNKNYDLIETEGEKKNLRIIIARWASKIHYPFSTAEAMESHKCKAEIL